VSEPDDPERMPVADERAQEGLSRRAAVGVADAFTLSTMCACGHPRRCHRGLRMEVSGPCLDCGCEEFAPARETHQSHEQLMERVRAGLDQVKRLQRIVAGLRSR
jgi:hypothetical protein